MIESFFQNKHRHFIDAETGTEKKGAELNLDFDDKQNRGLAFLYLDNSLAAVETFLAFLKSPHVLVLLNPKLNPEFKSHLESLYQPSFIYDLTRESGITPVRETLKVSQMSSSFAQNLHPHLKILLSTSGTTGSPKFVKLSIENLYQNALSISQYLPLSIHDVVPLNLPIYYSYGLSVLTSNLLAGGTIVCTNKDIVQKDFWADFDRYAYTCLAGVPYIYEILHRIGFTKKAYPSLRYMTQAGGKLSTKLIEVFHTYAQTQAIQFFVMYGQTEATARMSYLPPQYLGEKIGSIGKAIPNGRFRIDDETSELIYAGPNVFGGYAESPADLAHFESLSELHTGDLARVDDDGFYYITGRLKRFAKIFGQRLNLDEVESLLKNQFVGLSFAALGLNDEKLLITVEDETLTEQAVKDFLKDKLQIHPSVIRFQRMEKLPLTANGKINYRELSMKYEV